LRVIQTAWVFARGFSGEDRIALLETVREFAAARLDEDEARDDLRRRHAEHFLALAREARTHARGPREREWIDRLTVELDNLRAALDHALEAGDADLGLALGAALEPLWIRGMRQREGLRWLRALLDLSEEAAPRVRADALVVAGRSALESGDPELADPWLRAGLEFARVANDPTTTAWALHGLGHLAASTAPQPRRRRCSRRAWSSSWSWGSMRPPAAG
jgi:hypothetical protein